MATLTNFSQAQTLPADGYIREKELLRHIPFSHSTLWRKVKNGSFPKPIKLSEGVTAWIARDVHEWEEEKQTSKKPHKHAASNNNHRCDSEGV